MTGTPDAAAEARRAWRRLFGRPGRPGERSGDAALSMLADIGIVRRCLDHWS
ncbi:MAG: hypothetical protein JO147_12865 [Actinobacteria bacterium]|nr:hypothetical protein [Actinomycetota bacterium]